MGFGYKGAGASSYRDPGEYKGFLGERPTIGFSAGTNFSTKSRGFGFSGTETLEGHSRGDTRIDSILERRTAEARALAERIAEEKVRQQKAFEQRQDEQRRFEQRQLEQQKQWEQRLFEER